MKFLVLMATEKWVLFRSSLCHTFWPPFAICYCHSLSATYYRNGVALLSEIDIILVDNEFYPRGCSNHGAASKRSEHWVWHIMIVETHSSQRISLDKRCDFFYFCGYYSFFTLIFMSLCSSQAVH